MERSLADLITNATLLNKLEHSGYENVIDIKEVGVVQVTEELQLTTEEVQEILKLVHGGPIVASQTAEARIKADNEKVGISFSCKAFDELFDRYKGVPPSCITELCGEPGSGKTQICMQLAINAPACIYIDTEGSLFPGRLRQMAEALVINNDGYSDNNDKTNVDSILKKIHHFRVCDHVQLIALIRQLSNILDELDQVKLLILDSITYPVRTNVDIKLRNNILAFLGQILAQLAGRRQLAVVVTNHLTEDRLNTAVTPALGEDWGRRCANRFFLYRTRERRYARYYKSSLGTKDTTIQFKITKNGIEDESKDGDRHHIPRPDDENSSFKQYDEDDGGEDIWDSTYFTDQVISQIPSQDAEDNENSLKRKRKDDDDVQQSASDAHKSTVDEEDEFDCWDSEEEEDMLFFAAYNSPPC